MLPAPPASEPARPEPARFEPTQQTVPASTPAVGVRPELGANLSLTDLERVRRALKMLSEEPAGDTPVASSAAASASAALSTGTEGDEADTTPLPVILPGAAAVQGPELQETSRGPFEPARVAAAAGTAVPASEGTAVPASEGTAVPASEGTAVPASEGTAVQAAEAGVVSVDAVPADSNDKLPLAAAEKLDQIKDLLITAEAIGETNLDRHFERVSKRQRELIREFFDRAMPGREPES